MAVKRNVFIYFFLSLIAMVLGLSARHFSVYFPEWINKYLGDALWALMVFFLFGILLRSSKTRTVALGALMFSFTVEFSQLYHSQWIDALRNTRIGGLVLGYGFLWSDLVSYAVGIGAGILIERHFVLKER